jgi:outer membrane protein OmpA-like peptidoglycan-associated protein
MKRLLLAAGLLALPLLAPVAAKAQPIQGVYIGGSFGANFLQSERLRSATPSDVNHDAGYAGLASIGYALGNGVRLEVEGSYRFNHIGHGGVSYLGGNETKYGAMGNVLFDMDIGSPYLYPYLGAGAGYQNVQYRFGSQTPSQGGFAYQAIAGVAAPIPGVVGLSATMEYRYLGMAGDRSYRISFPGGSVSRKFTEDNNHSLMLGLRYAFNVVPPAPPPAPAPVAAAPAPAPARTYLVFFDWDRAELTPRARQIIASAAQAATHVQVTRIEVDGHADRTGTEAYNQALSLKRARNVAAELVRDGVAQQEISVQAFGDTRPLVQTAAGVREPQNRRVEIIFR